MVTKYPGIADSNPRFVLMADWNPPDPIHFSGLADSVPRFNTKW